MNKQTLWLFALICAFAYTSCSKSDNPPKSNVNNTTDSTAMKYIINGITDHTMSWTDSLIMPLAIGYAGGNQEKLTLSVSGLPQGATANFDVSSGIPAFASILTLRTNNTPGGVYDVKVISTTERDSVKTYGMKLTVNGEPAPCAKAGNYENVQTNMQNTSDVQTVDVTAELTAEKNHLLLKNCIYSDMEDGINWKSYDVEVILDCGNNTLQVVPKRVFDNSPYDMEGDGTFSDNKLDFTVKITPDGHFLLRNFHCVLTLK